MINLDLKDKLLEVTTSTPNTSKYNDIRKKNWERRRLQEA